MILRAIVEGYRWDHVRRILVAPVLIGLAWAGSAAPGRACGDGEAPTSCGDTGPEAGAKWMLKHVVSALAADKTAALAHFAKGEAGFRTADTYVFCVGPDGVMSAHPNPILQGQNVRDLHDSAGTYFISRMLETAKAGEVASIRYLFPKPAAPSRSRRRRTTPARAIRSAASGSTIRMRRRPPRAPPPASRSSAIGWMAGSRQPRAATGPRSSKP